MSNPTKAVSAVDTSATNPNPAQTADTSPENVENAPPADPETDFESYYLQQVTTEFADDLDKLRKASDFTEEFLPILIGALKGTAGVYSEEERAKVVGKR
ncbi:MAG: hypothetical protein Q9196_004034 [Gyalolechia fulgens]